MRFKYIKNKIFFIYIITFCFVSIINFIPISNSLAYKFYDLKLKICGKYRSDPYHIKEKIVTISIDNETISRIGYPTPFIHAKMIAKLKKFGAKFIFYDFIFRGNISPILIQSTKEVGNVYWPVSFDLTLDQKNAFEFNQYTPTFQKIIKKNSIENKKNNIQLWQTKIGLFSKETLINSAKGVGHISTNNDENEKNHVFRKTALLVDVDGYIFPNIDLIIACDYFGVPKEKIIINPRKTIVLPDAKFPDGSVKSIEIPVNDYGEMLINYIKTWDVNEHGHLEPFWFTTVLNLEGKPEREIELQERLKDKICLIGNASSFYKDVHTIPIDDNYPGIGIHSHILYTILSGNFIKEASMFYSFFIIIILILALAYIAQKINDNLSILLTFVCVLIYIVFSYSFFILKGISFNDFIPISGLFFYGIISLIYHFLFAIKKFKSL